MPIEEGLIGLWKLDGDCQDSSGNDNHGQPYGIGFSDGPEGREGAAAAFNGIDASICVEVDDGDDSDDDDDDDDDDGDDHDDHHHHDN